MNTYVVIEAHQQQIKGSYFYIHINRDVYHKQRLTPLSTSNSTGMLKCTLKDMFENMILIMQSRGGSLPCEMLGWSLNQMYSGCLQALPQSREPDTRTPQLSGNYVGRVVPITMEQVHHSCIPVRKICRIKEVKQFHKLNLPQMSDQNIRRNVQPT